MIAQLHGLIIEKNQPELLLSVHGLVFEMLVPTQQFRSLPEAGQEVKIWTQLVLREDHAQIYGFIDNFTRSCFKLLLKVSGVGPKVALSILSSLAADELVASFRNEEVERFMAIPGIGKKTAQRLVLELKEAFSKLFLTQAAIAPESLEMASTAAQWRYTKTDVNAALMVLGYKPAAISEWLEGQTNQSEQVESLVKRFLQAQGRKA